jgi:hypothetical protein
MCALPGPKIKETSFPDPTREKKWSQWFKIYCQYDPNIGYILSKIVPGAPLRAQRSTHYKIVS